MNKQIISEIAVTLKKDHILDLLNSILDIGCTQMFFFGSNLNYWVKSMQVIQTWVNFVSYTQDNYINSRDGQ